MEYLDLLIKYLKDSCLKYKIDLDSSSLFQNPHYNRLKYNWTIHCPIEMAMTLDYFVEKYILSQEQIDKMKKGNFDINVSIPPKRLSINALCREISKEEALINNGYEEDPEIIRQRIESDTGLKAQLKSKFKFNFDSFDDDTFKKLKLMKLIYRVHKQDGRLYDLLEKPSLEGVDNTSINVKTVYGELLSILKSETAKEVDKQFRRRTKDITFKVGIEWEQIIYAATIRPLGKDAYDRNQVMNRIDTYLQTIVARLPEVKSLDVSYNHSLFETFYLKILQYEQLGREHDLNTVHNYMSSMEVISQECAKKYYAVLSEYIKTTNIDSYIKKNVDKIAELVYIRSEISNSEKSFLISQSTIKQVNNLIAMWNRNTKTYLGEEVSLLFIISTLQEIKNTKVRNETYEIKYYGYKKEHSALSAKIKQGKEAREAYQLLWIRKINCRLYHNLGMGKEFALRTSIEKSIDKIISCILQYHNLDDLEAAHFFLIYQVNKLILHSSDYNIMIDQMKDALNIECNLDLRVTSDAFDYFREIDRTNLLEGVIEQMIHMVKQMKDEGVVFRRFIIPLEVLFGDIGTAREFSLYYQVDLTDMKIVLYNFRENQSVFNTYKKSLELLGMSQFFIH